MEAKLTLQENRVGLSIRKGVKNGKEKLDQVNFKKEKNHIQKKGYR